MLEPCAQAAVLGAQRGLVRGQGLLTNNVVELEGAVGLLFDDEIRAGRWSGRRSRAPGRRTSGGYWAFRGFLSLSCACALLSVCADMGGNLHRPRNPPRMPCAVGALCDSIVRHAWATLSRGDLRMVFAETASL